MGLQDYANPVGAEHDHRGHARKTLHHFLSGAMAGAISTTFTIPVDVLKTRIQTSTATENRLRREASRLYQEFGWKGFTKGLTARLMVVVPSASLTFTFYEQYKIWVNRLIVFSQGGTR